MAVPDVSAVVVTISSSVFADEAIEVSNRTDTGCRNPAVGTVTAHLTAPPAPSRIASGTAAPNAVVLIWQLSMKFLIPTPAAALIVTAVVVFDRMPVVPLA